MIIRKLFFTIILLSGLHLAKIGVEGSREPCPPAATVNLTDETANSSGYRNKSGDSFPPEATWTENGGTFGCLCDFKTCVQLCCPTGIALITDEYAYSDCKESNEFTFVTSRRSYEEYGGSILVIAENPYCSPIVIDDWVEKDYSVMFDLDPKKVYIKSKYSVGFEKYTITRLADSSIYISETFMAPDNYNTEWLIVAVNISMLFILTTLVIYSVIPELKNLQGSILRCYLISYIAFILAMTVMDLIKESAPPNVTLYSEFAKLAATYYFGVASMLWLNVMSFDTWRTLRRFESNQDVNIKECQKTMFIRYCVYSWGGAAVPASIFMGWCLSVTRNSTAIFLPFYLIASPPVFLAVCNTFFYILAAIMIKKRKKKTARLVNGVDEDHEENEQWFNSFVRLCTIIGSPMILWACKWYWRNDTFDKFIHAAQVSQSIAIFLIFVWKDDVKRLCRKRFVKMLGALNLFFGSGPTREPSAVSNLKTHL